MLLEMLSEFACAVCELGFDPYMPGEHFHQLFPDRIIQYVFGVDNFFSPQPLGNIGGYPPEFVAAVGERLGSRRLWKMVTVTRRRQRSENTVLIQQHQA